MSHEKTELIARSMMALVPLIMRVMNAELREAKDPRMIPAVGHMGLLGILTLRRHTLSDLAKRTKVSSATMSNTISSLVERGFVQRVPDDEDRRVVWIELTEEGRKALNRIDHHMIQRITALLGTLPDGEEDRLIEALGTLRHVFEQSIEQDPQLKE